MLKRLFILQIRHECLLQFFWLSTHDNFLADHLSCDREDKFLALVYTVGFWTASVVARRAKRAICEHLWGEGNPCGDSVSRDKRRELY